MKKFYITAILVSAMAIMSQTSSAQNFYDFRVKDIDGNEFSFKQLEGKKVMVVNVASKCGFTPQYEAMQSLYEKYASQGFVIVAFPANNFMNQEPGTQEEIKEFCSTTYGVSFPMMEKISVKGDDMHPLYRWLTDKTKNGVLDSEVKWNFQKYLIDEKGRFVDVAYSREKPDSERIVAWIEGK